jgi:CRISPR-associated endonuclease/helicase Cas3
MTRARKKAQRLNDIQRSLAQAFPDGVTMEKLAKRFGTDRTTISRDIAEMEADGLPIINPKHGFYMVDPRDVQLSLSLTHAESLSLYLAARRVVRQATYAIEPVLSSLEKLAELLRKPITDQLLQVLSNSREALPSEKQREGTTKKLVDSWQQQVVVRVTYQALKSLQPRTFTLHPYLFEPSLWGDGTYVIGFCEEMRKLTTFKVERIQQVTLTTRRFDIPDSIAPDKTLQHTWNVWIGEGEPVEVRLRFSREVARRVRETRWHPSERRNDLPDGGVEWQATVDEPQEMLPWIRGWGADVEVIAPEDLRQMIIEEVKRLNRLYDYQATPKTLTDRANDTFQSFFGE